VKEATTDETQIRAWWQQHPEANIGIATGERSGLIVLDIDRNGYLSLQQMEGQYGALPETPTVRTGGGGQHLYFSNPSGMPIRNRVGLLPGIDVRGDDGYVVGAGSLHFSGERYLYLRGKTPSQLPLQPCPAWLLNMISGKRSPKLEAEISINEGERNSALASLGGVMRRRGMSREAIEAALIQDNRVRCEPPLDDEEVRTIAASISKYPAHPDEARPTQVETTVPAEISLPFRTGAEVEREIPTKVDWIAKPWVAAGVSTELDGKVKLSGKTTWALAMAGAVLDGAPFMGQPTTKTSVVYLTEQNPTSFLQAMKRAGLLGRNDFAVLFWKDTLGVSWPRVMQCAVKECGRRRAKLLVVDTLTQFSGIEGDSENNAGPALAATRPLQQAAAKGIGVLANRHERKSGGTVGDSGRGSSAYGGAVDIVLSLRRPEGNHRRNIRLLQALSRFDETPTELLIELGEEGYRSLGEPGDVASEQEKLEVLAVIPGEKKDARDITTLCEKTEMSRAQLQRRLDDLLTEGKILRLGKGRKGDPLRYYAP
jgi:hypothetical protein